MGNARDGDQSYTSYRIIQANSALPEVGAYAIQSEQSPETDRLYLGAVCATRGDCPSIPWCSLRNARGLTILYLGRSGQRTKPIP